MWQQQVLEWIFGRVIQLNFLDGKRSYFAGAGFIMLGIGMLANEIASGVYDGNSTDKAIASIFAGLGIIGHAGKQDKIIASQTGGK